MGTRLANKVALVTGGGGSIGRAIVLKYLEEGAKVVNCDIHEARSEETLAIAREKGHAASVVSFHPCDLTDRKRVGELTDFIAQTYGRLDILVNNAGMAYFDWIDKISTDYWDRTIAEELDVVFNATVAAWPLLSKSGAAAIVNIGSVSGKQAYEVLPGLAHMAAKGGVIAMTKQMAMEGGKHNIRANSISPGTTRSNQTFPLLKDEGWNQAMLAKLMIKRLGEPQDIAFAATYLASDEAQWVTGADLAVDGGTTAW